MKYITTEKKPIKSWCNSPEEGAIEQAKALANLPFTFRHVALMPDTHQGYGMPIGGVLATQGVILPNAVGVDIGCGMCAVKTELKVDAITQSQIKNIMGEIRTYVPVGMKHHNTSQTWEGFNEIPNCPVILKELESARKQLGTLGGGNHFIELQVNQEGNLFVMLHSGSRNLGLKIAKHYQELAQIKNKEWFADVPKDLAFLPLTSFEGDQYFASMNYALKFAKESRHQMMMTCLRQIEYVLGTDSKRSLPLDVHHNYASLENHFGKNVVVHRKGATSAKLGESGIIPGSQGTNSYIVKGKGNPESFMSCSHGAGRKMSRTQAENTLVLEDEIALLDKIGVIHGIRSKKDLDEAPSAYKNIDIVMEEQQDLVEIIHKLTPIGVIKG